MDLNHPETFPQKKEWAGFQERNPVEFRKNGLDFESHEFSTVFCTRNQTESTSSSRLVTFNCFKIEVQLGSQSLLQLQIHWVHCGKGGCSSTFLWLDLRNAKEKSLCVWFVCLKSYQASKTKTSLIFRLNMNKIICLLVKNGCGSPKTQVRSACGWKK